MKDCGTWPLTAIDRLNLGVLFGMASLVAAVSRSAAPYPLLAAWLATLVLASSLTPAAVARAGEWIRVAVGVIVLITVYESLGSVIAGRKTPLVDAWLIRAERAMTAGRIPPLAAWDMPPIVVDALSVAYVAYFFMPIVLIALLYRTRSHEAIESASLTILVAFYLHYAIYLFLPAVGPVRTALLPEVLRSHLACQGGSTTRVLRHLVMVLEGTPQDAFPSAHTSISWLAAVLAWRSRLPTRVLFAATAVAVTMSTVVLGYHYCVDVIAAAPVAACAWVVAHRVLGRSGTGALTLSRIDELSRIPE